MNEHDPSIKIQSSTVQPCSSELHMQLVEHLREGSIEAFVHLVQDYKTPLFQFFYRLLSDQSVAEDSSEKVFLRAYRMRRLLRKGTDLTSWLFRIACSLLRDRKLKELLNRAATYDSPIQQAMHALTVQQRIVVLLHRFAGLSSRQLGTVLRVSEHAAVRRIYESYKALQHQLAALMSSREPRGFVQ